MHHGFKKDYRFLLSRLIPRHRLSSSRIEGIRSALASGIHTELIREAWLSMEELVSLRIYDRGSPETRGGEVHVQFTERSGPSRITLEMPSAEYSAVSGTDLIRGGVVPSVLAGIISALALDESPVNITDRLENLLDLAGNIDPGASAFLMLFSEFEAPNIRKSGRIGESSLADAESSGFYGASLGSEESVILVERGRMDGSIFPVDEKSGTVMLFPLRSAGLVYGLLEVHSSSRGNPKSDSMINYHLVAKGVIRVLDNNRQLERMVSIDRLTGVNNRNNYEIQLPLEMERATRNRKSLAFLIMDIDDFKFFNDKYGHDTGDKVLKLVADTVKKHLRKIDQLFRFGGEEFIALLPGAGREAAERTAERIREVVAGTKLSMDDGSALGITISVGGCIFPVDAGDEEELFRKADQAMYRAKREGKNKVSFFTG
ncbi:MAG: GGDEF domain-containing protein [Candidatus Krumholzibacteria bacterium]|nr:GGDEF domain-containing protein [Candidatus Krumholzibacteria bacterium]